MQRKKFNVRIWKWQEKLHDAFYEFPSQEKADIFTQGLFLGAELYGKEPTGSACQLVELLDEDSDTDFGPENELAYRDTSGPNVYIYKKGGEELVGEMKVWMDPDMDDAEYVTINHTITYLHRLKKLEDFPDVLNK